MVYSVVRHFIRIAFGKFIKSTEGKDKIPKDGGFIVIANHEGWPDPILIIHILLPIINKKIHFLSTKKSRGWKIFGGFIAEKWAGCIPVENGKNNYFPYMKELLQKKQIIGFFPEGSYNGGKLKMAKNGAVELSLSARVPILPIGLKNVSVVMPGQLSYPKKFKKIVEISIGKPIYFKEYWGSDVSEQLLTKLTTQVMKEVGKLIGQTYPSH